MKKASGFLVRLTSSRQQVFNGLLDSSEFAEAVDDFEHSRNIPLVCFVVSDSGLMTHVCLGSRGQRAGTRLRRLNLSKFHRLRTAITITRLLQALSTRSETRVKESLQRGGLLTPKVLEEVLAAVSKLSPDTTPILARYQKERLERIERLPQATRQALAEQKEAVLTAMAIADIDRDAIEGWDFQVDEGPTSFLAGLPQVRLREDQVVINDLSVLPGHEQLDSTILGTTVFEGDRSRLTVVLANRLPLEQQTGADLIYYNETFRCFLFVQYKMMEKEAKEHVFRFPNAQLTEEISRMDALLTEISKIQDDGQADGFRFSHNPFFLKLCPRITFDPDNVGLSIGMYLPLDYWKRISAHPTIAGPGGGNQITYRNVRRYFDNTDFVTIASDGWVGTHIPQSTLLIDVIKKTVESGRAAIIAINQEFDDPPRRRSRGRTTPKASS
jgi:hypothetical protein